MRTVGIDNTVSLSKDGRALYEDRAGRQGDLQHAMAAFASQVSKTPTKVFETLEIVLEHQHGAIDYLITIDIKRVHPVGEYPISMVIDGALLDGQVSSHDKTIFASNQGRHATQFHQFVGQIEAAFKKHMDLDDLHRRDGVNSYSNNVGPNDGTDVYDNRNDNRNDDHDNDHDNDHDRYNDRYNDRYDNDRDHGHASSRWGDNSNAAPSHTDEQDSGGWLSSLSDSFGGFFDSASEGTCNVFDAAGETLNSIGDSFGGDSGGCGGGCGGE